ncbi:hypothetical protein [Endozoicomonas sp. GU-1]|uniref:hypothetical protein n=1 Tax=Endozoicomonas sp. GU-1 TaxID=3009078 RepID=UPI0022B390FD|nr:hypothetical protein [Endozoicomonas sp. GU-1]WBA82593.1 hypothetical protein O2T12_05470 [Endozoicomonas sp. GU-1]WBA85522.1 hypothetical protein O3276_20125 [Endozoicomonas sp. GU-1]
MVLASAWHAIATMRQRRNRMMIGMGFTAFMGILTIMIHSSMDFNLQIPSNAAYFVVMMALALLARYMPAPSGAVRRPPPAARKR